MKRALLLVAALCIAPLVSLAVRANTEVQTSASSTMSFSGEIRGRAAAEYKLTSTKGQRLRVTLKSRSTSVYFNIFAPGKGPGDAAMFIGATSGDSFEGVLPETGTYTVQVYLVRAAARRGERAAFTLEMAVSSN